MLVLESIPAEFHRQPQCHDFRTFRDGAIECAAPGYLTTSFVENPGTKQSSSPLPTDPSVLERNQHLQSWWRKVLPRTSGTMSTHLLAAFLLGTLVVRRLELGLKLCLVHCALEILAVLLRQGYVAGQLIDQLVNQLIE